MEQEGEMAEAATGQRVKERRREEVAKGYGGTGVQVKSEVVDSSSQS